MTSYNQSTVNHSDPFLYLAKYTYFMGKRIFPESLSNISNVASPEDGANKKTKYKRLGFFNHKGVLSETLADEQLTDFVRFRVSDINSLYNGFLDLEKENLKHLLLSMGSPIDNNKKSLVASNFEDLGNRILIFDIDGLEIDFNNFESDLRAILPLSLKDADFVVSHTSKSYLQINDETKKKAYFRLIFILDKPAYLKQMKAWVKSQDLSKINFDFSIYTPGHKIFTSSPRIDNDLLSINFFSDKPRTYLFNGNGNVSFDLFEKEIIVPVEDEIVFEKDETYKEAGVIFDYDKESVEELLKYIPADDYVIWRNVGFGLARSVPDLEEAFDIFNEWSKTGKGYEGEVKTKNAFEYFSSNPPSTPITLGTIYYYARENGFKGSVKKSFVKNEGLLDIKKEGILHKYIDMSKSKYLPTPLTMPSRKVLGLKGGQGVGKSEIMSHYVAMARAKGARAIALLHRIALADTLAARLGIPSYQAFDKKEIFYGDVCICVNSLLRVSTDSDFDIIDIDNMKNYPKLIVIDEISQFRTALTNGTIEGYQILKIYKLLKVLFKNAEHIIVADADLSQKDILFLGMLLEMNEKDILDNTEIHETINENWKFNYVMWKTENEAIARVVQLARGGARVFIPTMSDGLNLKNRLSVLLPDVKIEVINKEERLDKARYPGNNPNSWFSGSQIVIASPTIGTGISFDQMGFFDNIFAFLYSGVGTCMDGLQSAHRVRHPTNNTIELYISQNHKYPSIYESTILKEKQIQKDFLNKAASKSQNAAIEKILAEESFLWKIEGENQNEDEKNLRELWALHIANTAEIRRFGGDGAPLLYRFVEFIENIKKYPIEMGDFSNDDDFLNALNEVKESFKAFKEIRNNEKINRFINSKVGGEDLKNKSNHESKQEYMDSQKTKLAFLVGGKTFDKIKDDPTYISFLSKDNAFDQILTRARLRYHYANKNGDKLLDIELKSQSIGQGAGLKGRGQYLKSLALKLVLDSFFKVGNQAVTTSLVGIYPTSEVVTGTSWSSSDDFSSVFDLAARYKNVLSALGCKPPKDLKEKPLSWLKDLLDRVGLNLEGKQKRVKNDKGESVRTREYSITEESLNRMMLLSNNHFNILMGLEGQQNPTKEDFKALVRNESPDITEEFLDYCFNSFYSPEV